MTLLMLMVKDTWRYAEDGGPENLDVTGTEADGWQGDHHQQQQPYGDEDDDGGDRWQSTADDDRWQREHAG